jgi:hypothetical protein
VQVEHLAIDGSVVRLEAEADLSSAVTATGWAAVPSLLRTHPFALYPSGHSQTVEKAVRENMPEVEFISDEDFSLKGGNLRIVQIQLPTATDQTRVLTVGAWEGEKGCLTTSVVGPDRDGLVEVFDTLEFSEGRLGLAIDSPVTSTPRSPEVVKEVPDVGILGIRPATTTELELVPRAPGASTRGGEVFRGGPARQSLLFVSPSSVVRIEPLARVVPERMLEVVESLEVIWSPREG